MLEYLQGGSMELIWRCCYLWIVFLICAATTGMTSPQEVTVIVDTTKVDNLVDERFLSLTIDPAMLLSGKDFSSEVMQLLHLAKGLSPAYLRFGSSDSNYYSYDFQNQFQQKNFTVTESDWVDLNLFAQEAGFDLIVCLNIMQRTGDVWDLRESVDLIAFSDRMGYNVTWELGYELQELEKNIPAGQLGRDVVGLRHILRTFPRYQHSLIIGPDITKFKKQEDTDFLKSFFYEGENSLNVITWHPEFREYLDNEDIHKQTSLKMNYLSQDGEKLISMLNVTGNMKPLWIGEKKNDSSHGSFRDALLWADKLGIAAQMSVQVIMHQPDFQVLFQPSPEYWVSLLHKSLVGRAVLKTKQTSGSNVHMYCHCTNKPTPMLSNNYKHGAITFFGVNHLNTEVKVVLKLGFEETQTNEEVHQYLLTSGGEGSSIFDSRDILLNGQKLSLEQGKNLPVLSPEVNFIDHNLTVTLPPVSIGFWVLPRVSVKTCIVALDRNEITSSTHEALEMNSIKDSIKYRSESQNDISTESNKELFDERMKQSNFKKLNLMDRKNINQGNGMDSVRNNEQIIDQDNSHFEDSFLEGKRPDMKNTVQERHKRYISELGTYVIPGLQSDLLHHSLSKSNIGIKNALWKRNRGDRFQKLSRKPKYEGNFISPFYDPFHQRSAEDMNDRFSIIFAEGRETHPFTSRNLYVKQSDGELSRERNNDYDYVDKDENAYDEDEHDPSEQEHFHGPAEFFETFQSSNVAGREKFAGYGGELSEAEFVLDSREQEEDTSTEDGDDNEMTNQEESGAEENEAAASSMMATYYEEISNEDDRTGEEKTEIKRDRNKIKKRKNHSINYVSEPEYDDGYENAERENRILRTNHNIHGTRSEDNDEIAPNAIKEYYEERERSVRRTRENVDKLKKHQKEQPQTERNGDYMKSKTDYNGVNALKKAKEQARKETSRIINNKRSGYISDQFDDFSDYKVKSKSKDVKSQLHNRPSQLQMSTYMRNLDDTKPKEKQLKKVVYRSGAQHFEKHNTDEENNAKTYLKKRMHNTENIKQTKMNRNESARRTQNNSDKVKVINKQRNYLNTSAEEDERKYLRSQEMSKEYQDESLQRSGKYYDKEVQENNRKTQNSNRNDHFRVKLVTNEEPRRIIRRHLLSQSSEESGSKENMWIDYIYQPNRQKDVESEKMTSREQYIIHTSNRKEMKLLNEADNMRKIYSDFDYTKGSKIKSQIRMDDKTKNHKMYDKIEALINLKDDEPLSNDVYIGYTKPSKDMKGYSQYNIGNKVDSIKNLDNTNQRFRKLQPEGSLEYFSDFNSKKLKNEIKKKQELRSGQTDEHDGTKIILPTDNSMEANKKQTLRTNAVEVLNNSNGKRSQSTASVIGQDEFPGIVTISRTGTQKDTRKNSKTSSDLDTIQKLDKTQENELNLEMYENELNPENAVVRLPKAVDDRLNLKYITSKVMNKGNKYGFIKSGIEQENGDFGKNSALSVELPLQKFQVEETSFIDKQSPSIAESIGDAILLHRNSVPIFTPRKLILLPEKKEVSGKLKNLRWNKIPDETAKSHSSEVENSTQVKVTENTELPHNESLRISGVKTEEVSTQQTSEEEQTTQQIPEEGQTTLQTYAEEQQTPEEKQEALEQVDQKLTSDVGQEIIDDIVTISALISEQIPLLEDNGDIKILHTEDKHSIQESSESEMKEVTKKLPVPVIDNIRNGVHSIIDQIGTTVRKASHSFKDDSKESETIQEFKGAHDNVKKIEDKIFQYTYGMINSRNEEDENNRSLSFESERTDEQDRIERNAEEDSQGVVILESGDFSSNRHIGSKLQEFQSTNDAEEDNFADPLVRNAKDIEHLNLLATKNILSNTNDVAKLHLSALATKEQIKAELEKKRLEALHTLNTHRAKLKEDLLKKKVLISDGILKLGHHLTRRDTESVMKMYQQINNENHRNRVDSGDSHISEEQNKESETNMKKNDNYLHEDNSWLEKIFSPESISFVDSGEIRLDFTFDSQELNFPRHSESQMVLTDKQSGADTFRTMDFESNPLFVLFNLEHHADLSEGPFHKELYSSEDADSKSLDSIQERNTGGESLEIQYVEMKQVPLPLFLQRPQLGRDPIMMQFYRRPTNENDIRFYLNSALEDSEDLTRTQRYSSSVMQSTTENDSEMKEEFSMSLSSESEDSDEFESQKDDILSKEMNQMTSSIRRSEDEMTMKTEYKPRKFVNQQMQSEQNNMQISELDVPLSQAVTNAYEKNVVSDVEITLPQDMLSKSDGTHGAKTIHINSKRSKRSPIYANSDILDNDLLKSLVKTKKEDPWTEDKMNYKYNVYSFLRNVSLGSDKETTNSKLVISNMLPENNDGSDLINMAKIEYELNHIPIGGHNITVIVDDFGLKNENITSNGTFAETFDSEAESNSVNDVNIETNEIIRKYKENFKFEKDIGNIGNEKDGSIVEIREVPYKIYKSSFRKKYDPSDNKLWRYLYKPSEANSEELINTELSSDSSLFKGIGKRVITSDEVENVSNNALKPMFEALETDPKAEEYANNASEIEKDYKSQENEEMQHFESHEEHKPMSTTENIGKVIKNFTNHIIKFFHKISPWNYFVH